MTFRFLFFFALAAGCSAAAPATALTNAAPVPAAVAPPSNPFPDAIPTQDITSKAEAVLAQYPAPSGTPAVDPIELEITQAMADKGPELQIFADQTSHMLATSPTLDRIRSRQNLGKYFAGFPNDWQKTITDRLNALGDRLKQIDGESKTWSDTAGALAKATPAAPPALIQRVAEVTARLVAVRKQTVACQTSLLALQSRVNDEHTLTSTALDRLNEARTRAITQLFERNAPPVWTGALAPQPAAADIATWSRLKETLLAYVRAEPGKFVIHGALLALLTFFFYWLRGYARQWTEEEPGIRVASGIFETPVATAALLSLVASPLLYYPIAPRLLTALLGALALVPSVILLRRLIEPRLFPILYALVTFFFLEEFRAVAALTPGEGRAFFLVETLGAILFLLWLLFSLHHGKASGSSPRFGKTVRLGATVALAFLAVGWIANLCGYVLLGNLLGEAVQRSATLALVLYAGILILDSILVIMTRLRPLSTLAMVRLHGPMLLARTERMLAGVAAFFWIFYTLELFSLGTPIFGGLWAFLTTYDKNHDLMLTFQGKLLAAVLIGWGIFQISRFVRFVLEIDFYPRLHLGAGIPYAISTSLHYALLVLAFLAATHVLGIDMTQFTIVISALGVGIGFGLQNIINNFVSGLILLFERPVKIGDSIQSGDATGVVEQIGIRASVLRTTTGAEMIVPNGNLISNSVTNWTLSSRERIVIIPFNVARGPDIGHLMELFANAAAAHPKVLKEPAPQVLVLTLGATLGFELRAWTREIEEWNVVRSELALAINAVLVRENIPLA
jgi:potassium efflux system protein